MKTNKLFFLGILGLAVFSANAQATQPTNAITTGSYLGTSNNEDVIFKRNGDPAGSIKTDRVSLGVNSAVQQYGVSIGPEAGRYSTYGGNIFMGYQAGVGSLTEANEGVGNVFIGRYSGAYNTTGSDNCFIGDTTGNGNATGNRNTFVGSNCGVSNWTGEGNTCVGYLSGYNNMEGVNNTFIGTNAGMSCFGSSNLCVGANAGASLAFGAENNIMIGNYSGSYFDGSNTLMIDNYDDRTYPAQPALAPLIWGNFVDDQLKFHGKVGIGGNSATDFGSFPTTAGSVDVSGYKLFVKGGILTEEIRVNLNSGWADYVFSKDYSLKPLKEVEKFIADNGHLPNVPSAKEVKESGIELGEMAKIQQEKIEELTLYLIQQNKAIEVLKAQVEALSAKK